MTFTLLSFKKIYIYISDTYDESKYSLVHFTLDKTDLRSNVQWWAYGMPPVNKITVLGQDRPITNVTINQEPCKKSFCEYEYSGKNKTLVIFNVNLHLDRLLHIQWTYRDDTSKVCT